MGHGGGARAIGRAPRTQGRRPSQRRNRPGAARVPRAGGAAGGTASPWPARRCMMVLSPGPTRGPWRGGTNGGPRASADIVIVRVFRSCVSQSSTRRRARTGARAWAGSLVGGRGELSCLRRGYLPTEDGQMARMMAGRPVLYPDCEITGAERAVPMATPPSIPIAAMSRRSPVRRSAGFPRSRPSQGSERWITRRRRCRCTVCVTGATIAGTTPTRSLACSRTGRPGMRSSGTTRGSATRRL
jgi:hypothetical protein